MVCYIFYSMTEKYETIVNTHKVVILGDSTVKYDLIGFLGKGERSDDVIPSISMETITLSQLIGPSKEGQPEATFNCIQCYTDKVWFKFVIYLRRIHVYGNFIIQKSVFKY